MFSHFSFLLKLSEIYGRRAEMHIEYRQINKSHSGMKLFWSRKPFWNNKGIICSSVSTFLYIETQHPTASYKYNCHKLWKSSILFKDIQRIGSLLEKLRQGNSHSYC